MELTSDVQKMLVFMLMIVVNPLPGITGLILIDTNATSCDGTGVNINFSVDLQTGSILTDSEIWYYETTVIATKSGGMFTPEVSYASRLHSYSSYGLTLDNITDADKGKYFFEFSYLTSTPQGSRTATTTLIVKVTPSENCIPSYTPSGDVATCVLNKTLNCGSPRLEPVWTHTSGSSFTITDAGNYTCCAKGSILTDCYRGSSSFCKTFDVPALNTTTTPSGDNNTGAIAGGVVGGIVFVCLVAGAVILIIYFYTERKRCIVAAELLLCNKKRWKESVVGAAVLRFISYIRGPCKGNQENGSSSVSKNDSSKPGSTSKNDKKNKDQQVNSTERNTRKTDTIQTQMRHNNRIAPEHEQSQSFNQSEKRALPMIPTERRGQTQPGTNVNNQGHILETPRANQLTPLQRPPQSTRQEEGTSEVPKQRKKKRKNKNIDERKSEDEIES